MTAPNPDKYEVHLEDCCSNVFVLTELCGLRWRRYIGNSSSSNSPLEDPVLLSFSHVLSQGNLCAWRKVPQPSAKHKGNQETFYTVTKELWIFWFGEEPSLSSVLSPDLRDADHGSWEEGLPQEHRTILFKALNNLLEKHLLSQGFVRVGKWFMKPSLSRESKDEKGGNLAFSFSYFIHGERTVCASVEVQEHQPIRLLSLDDITVAVAQPGYQVLLCPFGLSGTLTGQTFQLMDPGIGKLVDEWKKFYPLHIGDDMMNPEMEAEWDIPPVVSVTVDGIQMSYPSCYVMVLGDKPQMCIPGTVQRPTTLPLSGFCTASLTPPQSPADATMLDSKSVHQVVQGTKEVIGCGQGRVQSTSSLHLTTELVNGAWDEITEKKAQCKPSHNSLSGFIPSSITSGSFMNMSTQSMWSFDEPMKNSSCSCTSNSNISRVKPPMSRAPFGMGRPVPSPSNPTPSPQQTSGTSVKLKKERKKPLAPFHHRASSDKEMRCIKTPVSIATKGLATSNVVTTPVESNRQPESTLPFKSFNAKKYHWSSQPYPKKAVSSPSPSAVLKPFCIPEATSPECHLHDWNKIQSPEAMNTNDHTFTENITKTALTVDIKPVTIDSTNTNIVPPLNIKTEDEVKVEGILIDPKWRCYSLPSTEKFIRPSLPSDPLDCRPRGEACMSPPVTPTDAIMSPVFLESESTGIKRPLSEDEKVTSPTKKTRLGSASSRTSSRPPSESGPKTRRGSKLESPAATPDPFSPPPDEMDSDNTPQPSPVSIPRSERRRSSTSSTSMSPSPALPNQPTKRGVKPKRKTKKQLLEEQRIKEEEEKLRKEQENIEKFNSKPPPPSLPGPSNSKMGLTEIIPSPPSARLSSSKNLMDAKNLIVSYNDLENLFDESEDEDDNMPMPSTAGMSFSENHSMKNQSSDCLQHNVSNNSTNFSTVTHTDLTRMFPTPPSLEQISHSPIACTGDYTNPESVTTVAPMITSSPEVHFTTMNHNEMDLRDKMMEYDMKELTPVFETPSVQNFPLSSSFSPVKNLPSHCLPPLKITDSCFYRPSWQSKTDPFIHIPHGMESVDDVAMIGLDNQFAFPAPSPAIGFNYPEPVSVGSISSPMIHTPLANHKPFPELASPASSVSSNTVAYHPKTVLEGNFKTRFSPTLPESNSLFVNLMLSDSFSNYYSDRNFDGTKLSLFMDKSSSGCKCSEMQIQSLDKCLCGFSYFESRKFYKGLGLFPEDELHTTESARTCGENQLVGVTERFNVTRIQTDNNIQNKESSVVPKDPSIAQNEGDSQTLLIELLLEQGSSPFSLSLVNHQLSDSYMFIQTVSTTENKTTSFTETSSSVTALYNLLPFLQDAWKRPVGRKSWEHSGASIVKGPLSWKQLFHLAVPGSDRLQLEPVPSVLVGHDGDWLSLSPLALHYWEKLLLEPYTTPRDVAYIVVSPENDNILASTKTFFRELSSLYEACRLGRHVPITKVFRDGIFRVGQKYSQKLSKEQVDPWFSKQGSGEYSAKLRLYAQVCRHYLAPYLGSLPLDQHLLDNEKTEDKPGSKLLEEKTTPLSGLTDHHHAANQTNKSRSNTVPVHPGEAAPLTEEDQEHKSEDPPTIVVYLIDPFTCGGEDGGSLGSSPSYVGLLRCFNEMLSSLPDNMKNNLILQIVPVDQVLQVESQVTCKKTSLVLTQQLKSVAFSVYSRCRKQLQHISQMKSLTGFGTAALHETKKREINNDEFIQSMKIFLSPYILAPILSNPVRTSSENKLLVSSQVSVSTLFCGYCLSANQRWIIAVCTDSQGELVETTVIAINPPIKTDGRHRRRTPSRTKALYRLLEFCLSVMAPCLKPWRLILGKLGRMGHGEVRDWHEILSKTIGETIDQSDPCKACHVNKTKFPNITSVSTVSIEPEPAVTLFMAKGNNIQPFVDQNLSFQTPITPISKPDLSCSFTAVFPSPAKKSSGIHNEFSPAKEAQIMDTNILLTDVDDDESDQDPLRQLLPLLNSSPALSPSVALYPSTSPQNPYRQLASLPTSSPFQPLARSSPFEPVHHPIMPHHHPIPMKPSLFDSSMYQPLSQGYIVSTAPVGNVPCTFWTTCPQAAKNQMVVLRASLFVHQFANPVNSLQHHPLETDAHGEALRWILRQYNSLSWLTVDPMSTDRQSCLPVHLYMLGQLHQSLDSLL